MSYECGVCGCNCFDMDMNCALCNVQGKLESVEKENAELREALEQCFYHTIMRDPQVNTHKQACDSVQSITRETLAKIKEQGE